MISQQNLDLWKSKYDSVPNNRIMENIISKNSLTKLHTVRKNGQSYNPIYNHKVKPHLKVTNQKSSGRCWIFAALNVLRRQVVKKYKLENFEFSQSYLFFWDKLERMNYNLECIIKTREEATDSRLVQHLLDDPTCDGGQWDMICNLINKYGLVPKSVYNESYHSSQSRDVNRVLKKKFREYAITLRKCENPQQEKEKMINEVYDLLCKFFGMPPTSFDWEFIDKDKKYHIIKKLSPLTFYKNHVNFDVNDYICVINDPRNEYNKLYTVKYLGNVLDGNRVKYLNLPIKRLKELTVASIKDNESVWFGCDVGQFLHKDKCSMDFEQVDYLSVLNTSTNMSKKERLEYRDSLMTHAMVFTGVNIQETTNCLESESLIKNWEVENSWSSHTPLDGYYSMSDDWFSEYTYEIAINKKYLSDEEKEMLNSKEIKELPPWDPMGALA